MLTLLNRQMEKIDEMNGKLPEIVTTTHLNSNIEALSSSGEKGYSPS